MSTTPPGLKPFRPLRAPHIPDHPTEDYAKKLLACMEVQVLYFEQGEALRTTGVDSSISIGTLVSSRKLVPVIGVGWMCEHNTAIVYIDDKPYTIDYDWIGGHSKWLDERQAYQRYAGIRRR